MGLRFRILAALYLVMILLASNSEMRMFGGIMDVFAGLGALIILAVIALWPNASRADRVDRALDGSSWADRIDIEKLGRDQRSAD
jgi:hypothetical protein